jgi:hypothetical protein
MQIAKERLQQLLSNRQIYQEVEMKDAGMYFFSVCKVILFNFRFFI